MYLKKLVLVVLFFSLLTTVQSQRNAKPNIIFIFADDWGFGDLGVYGNKQIHTPNLDMFAKQATRFTRFHVTSGVCSPSRVSVLTGHYPARYRVHGHFAGNDVNAKREMPDWLPDSISVTLPKMLKAAGYSTAHFGKWHLGGGGLPHGDLTAPKPIQYGYDESRVWNGNGPTWNGTALWEDARYMDDDTIWNQHAAELAVDATLDFIDRNSNNKKPFFINLWLKEPHAPLVPSQAQRKDFISVKEPEQTYYSVINEADKQVGRLLSILKEKGLLDNTLIVFTSDNGPESQEAAKGAAGVAGPYKGAKRSLYEGGVCVPFIVYWKGKTKPGSVDSTSILSSVDILPTFCTIAGAKLPAFYQPDGIDISNVFTGEKIKRSKPLFWEWRSPNAKSPVLWMDGAILKDDWKLVQNLKTGKAELYNIRKDPFEQADVAKDNAAVVIILQQHWQQWKKTLP